ARAGAGEELTAPVTQELRPGGDAAAERRSPLAGGVPPAQARAGRLRRGGLAARELGHGGDAAAERRAGLAGDVFFGLVPAGDAVGACARRPSCDGARRPGPARPVRARRALVRVARRARPGAWHGG